MQAYSNVVLVDGESCSPSSNKRSPSPSRNEGMTDQIASLRSQKSVLKQAYMLEKKRCESLHEQLLQRDREQHKQANELETLKFNNQRLTKRCAKLIQQFEEKNEQLPQERNLQPTIPKPKSLWRTIYRSTPLAASSSADGVAPTSNTRVQGEIANQDPSNDAIRTTIEEELANKIKETSRLHILIQSERDEHSSTVQVLQQRLQELKRLFGEREQQLEQSKREAEELREQMQRYGQDCSTREQDLRLQIEQERMQHDEKQNSMKHRLSQLQRDILLVEEKLGKRSNSFQALGSSSLARDSSPMKWMLLCLPNYNRMAVQQRRRTAMELAVLIDRFGSELESTGLLQQDSRTTARLLNSACELANQLKQLSMAMRDIDGETVCASLYQCVRQVMEAAATLFGALLDEVEDAHQQSVIELSSGASNTSSNQELGLANALDSFRLVHRCTLDALDSLVVSSAPASDPAATGVGGGGGGGVASVARLVRFVERLKRALADAAARSTVVGFRCHNSLGAALARMAGIMQRVANELHSCELVLRTSSSTVTSADDVDIEGRCFEGEWKRCIRDRRHLTEKSRNNMKQLRQWIREGNGIASVTHNGSDISKDSLENRHLRSRMLSLLNNAEWQHKKLSDMRNELVAVYSLAANLQHKQDSLATYLHHLQASISSNQIEHSKILTTSSIVSRSQMHKKRRSAPSSSLTTSEHLKGESSFLKSMVPDANTAERLDVQALLSVVASITNALDHAAVEKRESSSAIQPRLMNKKEEQAVTSSKLTSVEECVQWTNQSSMSDLKLFLQQQTVVELDEMLLMVLDELQNMTNRALKSQLEKERADHERICERKRRSEAHKHSKQLASSNEALENEMTLLKTRYEGVVKQLTERVCELTEHVARIDAVQHHL